MRKQALFFLIFFGCACFLFFVGGALTASLNLPPATQLLKLRDSYVAFQEKRQAAEKAAVLPVNVHRIFKKAIIQNQEKASQAGYNLMVLRYQHSAQLTDMNGNIIHEWSLPFSKAFPNPSHISRPVPDTNIHFRTPHLYPNGDLLVSYEAVGDSPYGYGLVKMDKNSKLSWAYKGNVHHNQYVDQENGNIYAITQQFINSAVDGFDLTYPTLVDTIVILNAEGKELEKIPLLDAFKASGFQHLFAHKTQHALPWDQTHTNSVMKLEPDIAARFPLFKAGDILVSLRNMDALVVIDHVSKKVIWACKGVWSAQHSVSFLDNGHILLFDNRGNLEKNGTIMRSRILEIDPNNLSVAWDYPGTDANPLFSYAYGNVQRLDNGNTFITDTLQHRAFEVTPTRQRVWSITLPEQYKKTDASLPPFNNKKPIGNFMDLTRTPNNLEALGPNYNLATAIISATRYTAEQLPFLQHDVH